MAEMQPLLRQWLVLRTLSARRRGATLAELATETGVCQRTIRRDLTQLQQLGFPLLEEIEEYGRKRWRLDNEGSLAGLRFTVEEAAALYLGRQFLEPLAGTLFHAGARSAFDKIRATLGDAALRHLERLAAGFYHAVRGWSDYSRKAELIDDLVRAIEDRRMTAIEYQSLRTTEPVTFYDVYPYALIYWREALYLVAHSPNHGAVRTFKVDRISGAQVLQLQFAVPADFEPEQFLEHSFGIFQRDGEPARVRVLFAPQAARLLKERLFHPSQRLTERKDGRVLAEYRLNAFEEFLTWICGWGPLAEVLEPPNLREQVARTLWEAAELYGHAAVARDGHAVTRRIRTTPS